MIGITAKGDLNKTTNDLKRLLGGDIFTDLERFGSMGVAALSKATPVDSGISANSWGYRIIKSKKFPGIEWFNTSETSTDTPIVILVQYGHATNGGGYVAGRDFINPAMQPIFQMITDEIWKKVRA